MQSLKWLGVELVEVSLKEKFVSVAGATLAIYLVSIISHMVLPTSSAVGVVASMGATAVLLFAVPHGQLSQPWPLLGGHFVSALVGVSCAQAMGSTFLATAIAVGVSIVAMMTLAIAINYPFSWRRYPAAWIKRMANSIQDTLVISDDEHRRFVEAVRSIDSFVDVSEEDLVYLTRTMMQFTQSRGE